MDLYKTWNFLCLVIKIEHFLDVTTNYFKTLRHFKRWFFCNEQFSFKSEVEFRFALAQSLSGCIYLNDLPHPRPGGQRSVIACLHPFTFEILAKIKSYGIVSDTFYDNWKRKSGSGLRCKKQKSSSPWQFAGEREIKFLSFVQSFVSVRF